MRCPTSRRCQVWLKRRADGADRWQPERHWLGARLANGPRHPVAGMPPAYCTDQSGTPGPWHERLPHFRAEFTPSADEELQSEYLIPRTLAAAALAAVHAIGDRVAPVVQISEIRTIAADDLWLSPCYRRDSIGIHFTWIKNAAAVRPVMAAVEDALAPFGPRPHWGKLFGMAPGPVRERYPRLPDFERLSRRHDPGGKFRNDFTGRYLTVPG